MIAAAPTAKKVVLELGGKSPTVILPGADLARAVTPSILRFCRNAGQGCGATTRILVHRDDADAFLQRARRRAGRAAGRRPVRRGDRGRSADHRGAPRRGSRAYLARAVDKGATVLAGGGRPEGLDGFFLEPTLVGDVDPDDEICQDELFAPVAVVHVYDTVDEAVAIANNSRYGLNALVWGDPEEARAVAGRLDTGTVAINGGGGSRPDVPWAGAKQSGVGMDMGEDGFGEFFTVKHLQWPAVTPSRSPPAGGRDVGWLVRRWADASHRDRPFLTWAPFEGAPATWTRAEFARDVAALVAAFRARGLPSRRPRRAGAAQPPRLPAGLDRRRDDGRGRGLPQPRAARSTSSATPAGTAARSRPWCPPTARTTSRRRCPGCGFLAVSGGGRGADAVAALLTTEPDGGGGSWRPGRRRRCSTRPAPPPGRRASSGPRPTACGRGQVGAAHQGLGPADVNLVHLPLFHTNALSYSFLASLWSGGQVVLHAEVLGVPVLGRLGAATGRTWTSVVSFCVRALADREVPAGHRYRGWGDSACLDPVAGHRRRAGRRLVRHDRDGLPPGRRRPRCTRTPRARWAGRRRSTRWRSSTTDGGPVEPGASGTLHVRGERGVSLFQEYLRRRRGDGAGLHRRRLVRHRRPGAARRRAATLSFVERDKDVLKVGGENIGAPEIERVLLGVAGVREAAVVGRPDPHARRGAGRVRDRGARRGAVDRTELTERCATMLAGFKRPREVRVVDELPRSTLDKVAKARLRELLVAESADG